MDAEDHDAMRASDSDRAAVVERLRVAMDDGRLNALEYDDRVRAAYAATTYGDLAPLTADLPAPAPAPARREAAAARSWVAPWRAWLGGNMIFLAIWGWASIASGHLLFFWPAFFLLISAAGVARRGLTGRPPDPPPDEDRGVSRG